MKKSSITPKTIKWILLPALMLSGVAGFQNVVPAQPAKAQSAAAQKSAVTVGVFDEDKVGARFKKYQDALNQLDQDVRTLDSQLVARRLLDDSEGTRFDALIAKDKRVKTDEDAFQALVRTGLDRGAEQIRLMGNATRTAADTARLKQLQTQEQSNGARQQAISDRMFAKMKKLQEDTEKKHLDMASQAVIEVAAQKKLTMVWRKRAVIWSAPAIDITDAVLARLNK